MSTAPETLEAEVIPPTQALAIRDPQQAVSLFRTDDPAEIVVRASNVATSLKAVIQKQGLISKISGKEYPRCEAWTLLGTMLGVFPVLCWSKPVDGGWEARVEARTRDGAIVGAAEAQCLRGERNWKDRDDFALRSMAQTRATAKCLRMPLGFVMTLAGYEATPAEEMTHEMGHESRPAPRQATAAPARPPATPQAQSPTPTPKPVRQACDPKPAALKPATEATRAWMCKELEDVKDLAAEYFSKLQDPTPLMPGEALSELPLRFVPNTPTKLKALRSCILQFGNGERAIHAYPYDEMPDPAKAAPAAAPAAPAAPKAPKDDEAWREVIVPIPRKGMKRDDYLKNPDTIGSLYDLRHGSDDEAAAARQRLWGFTTNFEPKGWTKRDGTTMPASQSDHDFRAALDAFADWFEKNHPGEKL